jgi:hypothetical protein
MASILSFSGIWISPFYRIQEKLPVGGVQLEAVLDMPEIVDIDIGRVHQGSKIAHRYRFDSAVLYPGVPLGVYPYTTASGKEQNTERYD